MQSLARVCLVSLFAKQMRQPKCTSFPSLNAILIDDIDQSEIRQGLIIMQG